jgi:hypothetical protein
MKPHSQQIRLFLTNLAEQDWLKRTSRYVWPKFLYHYTDIRNVIKILKCGYLFGRKYAEEHNVLAISSGSPKVLQNTRDHIKSCVRLYFRPMTPTQYHSEGIRSQRVLTSSSFPDAHCPVPVFLLFDSFQVLTRDDSLFSNKGLGSRDVQLFNTFSELQNLPWRKIYHTGPFDKTTNPDITASRMAEVLVPKKLSLESLRYIYCRSEAEKETLLYLLPEELRSKYKSITLASTRREHFFRKHTFIETVSISQSECHMRFSPETESRGPFNLNLVCKDFTGRTIRVLNNPAFEFHNEYVIRGQYNPINYDFELTVTLDNHLAYANIYQDIDIPF